MTEWQDHYSFSFCNVLFFIWQYSRKSIIYFLFWKLYFPLASIAIVSVFALWNTHLTFVFNFFYVSLNLDFEQNLKVDEFNFLKVVVLYNTISKSILLKKHTFIVNSSWAIGFRPQIQIEVKFNSLFMYMSASFRKQSIF